RSGHDRHRALRLGPFAIVRHDGPGVAEGITEREGIRARVADLPGVQEDVRLDAVEGLRIHQQVNRLWDLRVVIQRVATATTLQRDGERAVLEEGEIRFEAELGFLLHIVFRLEELPRAVLRMIPPADQAGAEELGIDALRLGEVIYADADEGDAANR